MLTPSRGNLAVWPDDSFTETCVCACVCVYVCVRVLMCVYTYYMCVRVRPSHLKLVRVQRLQHSALPTMWAPHHQHFATLGRDHLSECGGDRVCV